MKLRYFSLLLLALIAVSCSQSEQVVGIWVNSEESTPGDNWIDIMADGTFETGEPGGQEGNWQIGEDGRLCFVEDCREFSIEGDELTIANPNKTTRVYTKVNLNEYQVGEPTELVGRWTVVGSEDFLPIYFDFLPQGVLLLPTVEGDAYWGRRGDLLCLGVPFESVDETDKTAVKMVLVRSGACTNYSLEQDYLLLDLDGEEIRLRKSD